MASSALLLLLFIGSDLCLEGQVSARTNVVLTATLPGYVSLSTRSIPISIFLRSGTSSSNHASFPLKVTWNLNPREVRGFEVVSYFADPRAALVDVSGGNTIPAERVLGRWGTDAFRQFNETSAIGPAGASLPLFEKSISPGNSRGAREDALDLSVDPAYAPTIKDGKYTGVLYIEVRYY